MTARVTDINGWYEIPRNPISCVGVFPYSGKQIGAPLPDAIYQVYTPEEELSSPDTIASFRLLPWTDDHSMLGDPAMDPALTAVEDKPAQGTLGEQIEYDPTDRTLYANLKMWGAQLGNAIDAGKKELSCGFRCVYDFTEGVFEGKPYQAIQRFIRGNHLASVAEGRRGSGVAVLDHLKFTFDAKEFTAMLTPAQAKKKKTRDELFATLKLPDRAAFDAAMDAAEKTDGEGEGDGGGDGGGMTIADVVKVVEEVAPQIADLTSALSSMGGAGDPGDGDIGGLDEDMEPMLDAAGAAIMGPDGKPKMQKKVKPAVPTAPAADAVPAALAAMDTALKGASATSALFHKMLPKGVAVPAMLATMDSNITKGKAHLARLVASQRQAPIAAMDSRMTAAEKIITDMGNGNTFKKFAAEIKQRDALAERISQFVGTFDHSEMSVADVAKYGVTKFGLKTTAGSEVAAVEGYLYNRTPPSQSRSFALDAAATTGGDGKTAERVGSYLDGKAETKAA